MKIHNLGQTDKQAPGHTCMCPLLHTVSYFLQFLLSSEVKQIWGTILDKFLAAPKSLYMLFETLGSNTSDSIDF